MSIELLRRLAPFLRYDSMESFFADSCASIVENARTGRGGPNALKREDGEVIARAGGRRDPLTLDYLRGRRYPNGAGVRRSDYVDAVGRNYVEEARALHSDPRLANRVYGRVATGGDGRTWLQYWFFYYYNSKNFARIGLHEGDWEMIQIRLGVDGGPDAATFAQHRSGAAHAWSEVEIEPTPEGGAPVVYVARGSHASFPHAGTYWTTFPPDRADGRGALIRPALEVLPDRSPGWIAWPGRWGSSATSPPGPRHQSKWGDPSAFHDDSARAGLIRAAVPGEEPPAPEIAARRVGDEIHVDYALPKGTPRRRVPSLVISLDAPDDALPPQTYEFPVDARRGTIVHPAAAEAARQVVRACLVDADGVPGDAVETEVRRADTASDLVVDVSGPGEPALPDAIDGRILDARPDPADFRDLEFVSTLVEVPAAVPLDVHRERGIGVRDQGPDGACTGFALAAVVDTLLQNRDGGAPDPVSARMLYHFARRNDEWSGEDYSGSSARGAMKGWHKRGVCRRDVWGDFEAGDELTAARAADALDRPLGAYYRVNKRDLVAMHAALAEVGVLYATATIHRGWSDPPDGLIEQSEDVLGGHAFAVVGYERDGFWIQNSWGPGWGRDGHALLTYDDWLTNAVDAWVARLGAPVKLGAAERRGDDRLLAAGSDLYAREDLRRHVVHVGNDGLPKSSGTYGNTEADIRRLVGEELPRAMAGWSRPRVLLYAHGGLVSEESSMKWVARNRGRFMARQIYPLSFIWHSDAESTLKNILSEIGRSRKAEGIFDRPKDYLRDRLDDALEPLSRSLGGKALWDEMKENALGASRPDPVTPGAAWIVADALRAALGGDPRAEIHLAGHSAGGVFHAGLTQIMAGSGPLGAGPHRGGEPIGLPVASCALWAPACTMELFTRTYRPALESGALGRLAVFLLSDEAELADRAGPYHKSLLYLVSHAFEERLRVPWGGPGVPILGMEVFATTTASPIAGTGTELIVSPNTAGGSDGARASTHGGFDDDARTIEATIERILATSRAGP